jgi:ABC-type transport system substrate-binding protein
MSGLPGAESEVDTSATMLQLDMASAPDSQLSVQVRTAIALSINRQSLVDQQAVWAYSSLAVADSHVNVQGQATYKPASTGPGTTTTIPPSSTDTSTTTVGSGGNVNFPETPVPDQASQLLAASGLTRLPGSPYVTAFGMPFQLRLAYDESDPWASAAAPALQEDLQDAGLETTLVPVAGATPTGQALSTGAADVALLPATFTPYMSQTLAWYTSLLGPAGSNGSQNWTGYSSKAFEILVQTASQQLNADTEASDYDQADTQLWQDMVSLPLFVEPTALVWSSRIGGVMASPRSNDLLWFAQYWAVRVPESTSNTTPSLPGP